MLRLNHIRFACDEPERVAGFWTQLLDGYSAEPGGQAFFGRGDGPELFFNRVKKSPTIEVPIHLDVNVPDREADLERVLELGGSLVETRSHQVRELSETWTVMRDPEGNGFCLSEALGWPDEEIDEGFLNELRGAGIGEYELTGFYVTRPPGNGRPRFLFQRREKSRPESYPMHLDFLTDDREAEVERLQHKGATLVETKSDDRAAWTVMGDREGNPFCVE